MKKNLLLILTVMLVAAHSAAAQGLVTFAQFIERNGSQDFAFANNGQSADFNTVAAGSPIFFRYQNINNLDAALSGFQEATLRLSATTTAAASNGGGNLSQPINGAVNRIEILRDIPAPVGRGTRRNLLTVTFAPLGSTPTLAGAANGNSATFSVTTPDHTVTFTSDFLRFNNTVQRNLALSFSSVLPRVAVDANNFLESFSAAASGTFAANPPPVYAVVTAAVEISGRVLTSSNAAGVRGGDARRRAQRNCDERHFRALSVNRHHRGRNRRRFRELETLSLRAENYRNNERCCGRGFYAGTRQITAPASPNNSASIDCQRRLFKKAVGK